MLKRVAPVLVAALLGVGALGVGVAAADQRTTYVPNQGLACPHTIFTQQAGASDYPGDSGCGLKVYRLSIYCAFGPGWVLAGWNTAPAPTGLTCPSGVLGNVGICVSFGFGNYVYNWNSNTWAINSNGGVPC